VLLPSAPLLLCPSAPPLLRSSAPPLPCSSAPLLLCSSAPPLLCPSAPLLLRFSGLKAYKAKFADSWEPRYVVYRNVLDLPKLALALTRISELGEEG
jgi:hypothetical protein